jgi:cell division protein FtsB
MLEVSTVYLLLAMFGFVLVGIVVIHHHNSSDMIRRKRNEVRRLTVHLEAKNSVLEEQIADLKDKVDDLDEQIGILEQRAQAR